MALAIDPSTPAAVSVPRTGTVASTAAFSPPANSVIFLFFSLAGLNIGTQSVASITDSLGTHLTWTYYTGSRDNLTTAADTEVWWASCPSAQTNMTITATFATSNANTTQNPSGVFQAVVFTGAATTQNGNVSIRNSAALGTPSQTLTTSADNSWVFGAIQTADPLGVTLTGANQSYYVGNVSTYVANALDGYSFWVQLRVTPTVSASTTVTLDVTAPTSTSYCFSMIEVLAAPDVPNVSSSPVTDVTGTTATGNGTVVSDGGSTITERGICWSTTMNPTTSSSKATAAGTTGAYSASITGLTSGTLYHVRAYAINALGTDYGDDVTFQYYPAGSSWIDA